MKGAKLFPTNSEKKFSNLKKEGACQGTKVQKIPNRKDPREKWPQHIVIKTPNIRNQ